jgi:hypothetical protein
MRQVVQLATFFVALMAALFVAGALAAPALAAGVPCTATGGETVAADKRAYQPGEVVHLTGAGYATDCDVVVKVTRPDGAVVTGDGSGTAGSDTVATDLFGGFSYDYQLPSMPAVEGWYTVEVLGFGDALLAQTSFVDAFAAGKLFLGSLAGPENYIYTAGDAIVSDSDIDASSSSTKRAYKFFVLDASNAVRNSPTCTLNGAGGGVSYSYTVQASDPPSTSADYEWVLRQYSGATDAAALTACNADTDGLGNDREKTDSKEFNVAKATVYANSALTTQQTSFGAATTLTGTVAKTNGGSTLTGTGTAFLSQLAVGDTIAVPHSGGAGVDFRRVTAISSNTCLTVNLAWSATASGQTASRSKQAYVTVAGLEQNQGDYSVTWLLPSGGTACANTGGGDQPNSDADGDLPNAAPAYLEYVPSDSAASWNRQSSYESAACPLFSAATQGQWKLKLQRNNGHFVTLKVFSVNINNAPTAAAGGPYSGNEGSAIQLDGSGSSDPDAGDTLTYAWSAPSGCALSDAAAQNPTLTCVDNGSYTVSLTVTDSSGAASSPSSATVTVSNVAPTASFPATRTVNEGSSSTFAFTGPSDSSAADTAAGFHYAFSCTGASLAGATYSGSGTAASVTCSFADGPSSPTVRARIIDKDGGFNEYTTAVTVNNVAPSLAISGAASVSEGSAYSLTLGAVSDPGQDTVSSYVVHWGDGSSNTFSSNGVKTHTYADGPATRAITVDLVDEDGTFLDRANALSVTVNNVAPSIAISGAASVNEGSVYSPTLGAVSDPGADTVSSYVVHWGDGSSNSYSSNGVKSHTYVDGPADHAVTVDLVDEDGTFLDRANTFSVHVNNVAPSIAISGAASVSEGSAYSLTLGAVSDPGQDTVSSYVVHWGDGSSETYSSNGVKSHTYADGPADHAVKVDLVDEDGTFLDRANALSVHVNNVAPSIAISGAASVNEGSAYSLTLGAVSDPGQDTVSSYVVHWGDGSSNTYSSNGAKSHTYADGPDDHAVTVDLVDEDGTFLDRANTLSVHVNNVAPTVNLAGPNSANEGETKTYTFTLSDPGADTFSFVAGPPTDYPTCGQYGELVGTPTVAGGSFQCRFPDGPNTTNVAIKIQDDDGGVSTPDVEQVDIIPVTIANVAPALTAATDQTANEGESKSFALGSFSDDGVDDSPWTVDVDWGDGSPAGSFPVTAQGSISQSHAYDDNGTYTVTVKVTDKDSAASAQRTFQVAVANVAPTATFTNSGPVDEGTSFTLSLSNGDDVSSADKAAKFTFAFDCGDGTGYGSFTATPTPSASVSCSTNDSGTRSVKAKIRDKDGGVREYTGTVAVNNVAPTATFNAAPSSVNEGSSFTLSLASPSDPSSADSAAGFSYAFDCGDGSGYSAYGAASSRSCPTSENGTRTVKGKIRDKDGGETEYTKTVTVGNVAPVVNVTSPSYGALYAKPAIVNMTATFSDAGTSDTHTCSFNWDDTTSSPGTVSETNGSGTCTGTHTYNSAGVYTVKVTVTDDDGASTTVEWMVVVYDPSAGFVTGGGWIDVAPGSYPAQPGLFGRANFGFSSQYKKGATVPTGETEFQFQVGNFNFHSSKYDYLVVSGFKAQFKGTGEVNGGPGYSFRLTAYDGALMNPKGPDKFRIKVMDSTGAVVFDNRMGTPDDVDVADPQVISGGSIVIHKA